MGDSGARGGGAGGDDAPSPLLRTLYWASGSPPAWRALLTLAEKRIPFNSVMVTFESGVLRTPAHLALNPRGLVPVLVDGPVRMYESLAIIQARSRCRSERVGGRACSVSKDSERRVTRSRQGLNESPHTKRKSTVRPPNR